MTTNIIPFDGSAKLPAYLANRATRVSTINQDILGSGPTFPVLSIKGKVFTLVKGKEKKVLTRADDPDEVLQSINLTVVRANTKSRVFYAKAYTEGESDGAKPTCFSGDGVAPAAGAAEPQSKKCAICPQNVWGVRDGKGTACSQNTRLAVMDAATDSEAFLLRVPPASRKAFADTVRMLETRGLDYNMAVVKVGFDKEAPSPKLTFKPVGLLDDASYARINDLFEDDIIKEIVGLHDEPAAAAPVADEEDMSELDAALAAKKAQAAAPAPAAKPATPKPEAKPAPAVEEDDADDEPAAAPAPAPAPAKKAAAKKPAAKPADDADDLLGDLDALLSSTDD